MSDVQEKLKSWLPKRPQAWGILKTRLTKDDSEQVCGVSACVVWVCVSEGVCI